MSGPDTPGLAGCADEFYELLVGAHQGLTQAQSAALNSRLILLLADRVGELAALRRCLDAARAGID